MLAVTDFDTDTPAPKNDEDWKIAVWYRLAAIHSETRKTNGRVTRIERWLTIAAAAGAGILIGLGLLNLPVLIGLL